MLIVFTGIATDLLFLFSFVMSIKKDYYVVIPEDESGFLKIKLSIF